MLYRVVPSIVALCLAPAALRATLFVPAEFREIVNGSDIIAYGRVVETVARMSNDRTRTETFVTLRVGTYLKGGPGETLVFTVPGGQIGRYRDVMVGAPQFNPGDEAVVFLNAKGLDRPVVFGLNQGVFRVRLDAQTKRRLVVPPAILAAGERARAVVRGDPARRTVAIETFGAQIQAVLAEADARSAR